MHITEVIREWMGWCPNNTAKIRTVPTVTAYEDAAPSAGGSFRARTMNWLGLFRNQMIVMALYFSVVGILLSVLLGGFSLTMFFTGIVAGTLLSGFQGIRFWKTMNEVRDEGAVFLATLWDRTTIATAFIVAFVPVAVSAGAIPGITMSMMNSISGGFIFILCWGLLFVVWRWESQAKRQLKSDGLMLSLAREA